MYQQSLTPQMALQKLKQFCAYQERSHYDVKKKLYELNVAKKEHDAILATLIEENFISEERFSKAMAGGKFRMKKWGRKKIEMALKQKGISEYCIDKALSEIDDKDYRKTLQQLLKQKYESLKSEQYLIRKKKTFNYLMQKGYEPELIEHIFADYKQKLRGNDGE